MYAVNATSNASNRPASVCIIAVTAAAAVIEVTRWLASETIINLTGLATRCNTLPVLLLTY